MILVTLPLWILAAVLLSIPLGIAIRRTRRTRLFRGWVLVGALILLFEGTSIPHGAWAIAWYFDRDARPLLEDLDLLLSRSQREAIVQAALDGDLTPSSDPYALPGDYALPDGFAGLTDDSPLWVQWDECGIKVFFRTMTGFSPDPYGGFEYSPPVCPPELDPLGSGFGIARDLGGGWYWIDAS